MTPMRSSLGRAIGLGSAKEGVGHWWRQRVSAMALVPLTLWLVISVIGLIGADHAAFVAWVRSPMPADILILLLVAPFYNNAFGLKVVVDDNVPCAALRVRGSLLMRFFWFRFAA